MSACLSGDRRGALDSRLCTWIVLRGTRETPASARSSGLSPASRPEPRAGCRCCSRRAERHRRVARSGLSLVARSPVGAAPDGPCGIRWPHRSCRVPLLALGCVATRTQARSAVRNARASAPTSSVVTGGSASGTGRSALVDVPDAASSCGAEGAGSAARGRASQVPRTRTLKEAGETGARITSLFEQMQAVRHPRRRPMFEPLQRLSLRDYAACRRAFRATWRMRTPRQGDGPPRARTPNRRAPRCGPRHHRGPQHDDRETARRRREPVAIARCTATASSINPAVPHNARRAAATNFAPPQFGVAPRRAGSEPWN